MLIFTDDSSNGRAANVNSEGHGVKTKRASAQIVEVGAVAIVFQPFENKALYIYIYR